MKAAISSGMDFTTSLNTMQSVARASSAQIAQVSEKARQLGTDNQLAATSSVDAAQAMVELAKGGFTVDQSMTAARGTLQLAAAAQISAADAATIQSQALQAFGKDASFAGTASDILANAANQSSAEITDVAMAFQQSGAVANQFGLSMNDTAATIALLANAGIQGSDAGTLLKSTLLALTDQSKPAQGAIDELGLTVYDAQGKFVGMEKLFGQLQTASKRMTPEMYQAATATLFGSDAARIAGVAAQQGAGGFDKMRDAMGQQGAAAQVAAAKMNGLPGAWEKFKNAAQDAGLAFYDAVQGPLTSAATWAADAIGSITDTTSGLGAKVKDAFSSVSEAFQNAGGMELVSDWGSRIKGVFDSLWGSIQNLLPVVGNLGEMFAQAGAIVSAVGIETFVSVLEAAAGILDTTIVPVLQLANSALSGMQPIVVGAVAAWLGFKAVGPALAGLRTSVATLGATTATATGRLTALATAQSAVVRAGSFGSVQMGRFGTAIAQVGQQYGSVARMQSAFVTAASGADRFGRTAGVAAAAGSGLRSAGAGLAGVFGGPVGIALAGAAVVGTLWASSVQRQSSATEAYRGSLASLAEEQKRSKDLLLESKGALNADVYSSVTSQVNSVRDSFVNAGKATADWNDALVSGLTFGINDQEKRVNDAAAANRSAATALNLLGMTSEAVGRQVAGSSEGWNQLKLRLLAAGDGGQKAAESLQGVRDKILQQQDIGRRVTPGVTELGTAFQVMGDKGASASDKLNALKAAMDAMNPARSKTEADAQYGEAVRKAAEAVQGVDNSAFDPSGKLNAMSEAGANLSRTLSDLAEKSAQVASNNGNMGAVARANEQQFQALATATNQPIEKIRELYASLGGKAVDLSVQLQGAPDVINQLAAISTQWNNTPEKKTIEVEESSVNAQTRAALERLNASVSQPKNGIVTITANDAVAQSRILMVTRNVSVLNTLKAFPSVDLNKVQFDANNAAARGDLNALAGMNVAPQARLVIDQLLQGKAVSISALDQLSRANVTPEAKLLIDKLLADAGVAKTTLDDLARARTATITVKTVSEVQQEILRNNPSAAGAFSNADGSIRKYADGGLSKLPDSALIQKPKGAGLVQWAEPETKGEAFIPLAESKRGRSQNILATVADMFGFALLPKDNIPDTLSGQVGGVAGGALSSMLKSVGGGVAKFADGGIRTAQEIRAFVNGAGASRPLTGAPYERGGVNWGDCSGAMAAIARFAAGLAPFAGRFATANEGDALAQLGAKMGAGGAGTLRFGWYNGGPGGGHTAGTLPDGTNVEMGGQNGGGMVGGSVGASDAQFTNQAYMEVKGGAGDAASSSDASSAAGSSASGSSVPDSALGSGYTFDPITSDTSGAGSGDTSLSGRAGSVASAFITGQMQDLFKVLSINDQPGWLSAVTEYEKQHSADAKKNYDALKKKLDADYKDGETQRKADYDEAKAAIDNDFQSNLISAAERDRRQMALKAQFDADEIAKRHDYENDVVATAKGYGQADDSSLQSLSMKQRYENEQLSQTQQLSTAQFDREAQYDRDKKALESLRDSKSISQDEYQRRLAQTKAKYDADMGGIKDRFAADQGALKERFDRSQDSLAPMDRYIPNTVTTSRFTPSDPGTSSAGSKGDANVGASTGSSVKDAVKQAFADKDWSTGPQWEATDFIVQHESGWNPTAVNPTSGAFGLFQFLGSTMQQYLPDRNPDPGVQGEAGERYIADRYKTPVDAQKFWQANNWYDQGGAAIGTGLMAKNVLAPERVLSPRQTAAFEDMVRRDFQGGGNDEVIAKLDQLIGVMSKRPPVTPVVVPDEAGRRRVERDRVVQRHLVGK